MTEAREKTLLKKFGIIVVVNIILLVSWIFLTLQLPSKATVVKDLRNKKLLAGGVGDVEVLKADLEVNQDKIDKIQNYFVSEDALLEFTKVVDGLRADGVVTDFSFASDKLVADKAGNKVLPFSIDFKGSVSRVSEGLKKIEGLPYIIKAVESELDRPTPDGDILLTYRGFLYVTDTFSNNQ